MHSLKKKMKKQGGFTLIEMLIVVAIIAILVAVSIPLVNNALEKARIATDEANERAAKAAIMIAYLTEGEVDGTSFELGKPYYYDAAAGELVASAPSDTYGKCADHANGYIKIEMTDEEKVVLEWQPSGANHNPGMDAPSTP